MRSPKPLRRSSLLLAVASALCPAAYATTAPPAHESLRIGSRALAEERRINVYLPPGYDACTSCRYPVLYMPDGGIAEDFPHVAAAVDTLVRSGRIEPMLVVGFENTNRRRDMTGPTQNPEDRRVTDQPGGSGRLRAFLAHELMPVVRSRYRVSEDTAIIGESLAGLFIVETMFVQPGLFDTYIALDPSLWWNSGQWIREAAPRLAEWDGTPVRLYLATGGEQSNAEEVGALAQALGAAPASIQVHYEAWPELRHDNIYRSLEQPLLQALFPPRAGDGVAPVVSPAR